ncbi:RidA family protein [Paludibacterium purpuratum]|uniref:RidA family protein n=1 Tax=Paludibacterium purpuratum TaxID=1144873 RepID=UPI0014151941|nr:RidA family protein [Paludibacterium purpuratum]
MHSKPIGHYSPYQTVPLSDGTFIFISGQVAVDSDGNTIGSNIGEQAVAVFENLKAILEACGGTISDLVKVTIFLRSMADFEAFNTVRNRYFDQHRPASTLVEVSALAVEGHHVEIEGVAYVRR